MSQNRREFIEQVTAGAMLAGVPFSADVVRAFSAPPVASPAAEEFDLSWTKRVTGKYRAVMDVPEIDSAYGVWRGSFWAKDYADMLKASPKDCSSVIVLRHNGIALAMQQSFWDTYGRLQKESSKASNHRAGDRSESSAALVVAQRDSCDVRRSRARQVHRARRYRFGVQSRVRRHGRSGGEEGWRHAGGCAENRIGCVWCPA